VPDAKTIAKRIHFRRNLPVRAPATRGLYEKLADGVKKVVCEVPLPQAYVTILEEFSCRVRVVSNVLTLALVAWPLQKKGED
jgi:hypothetical protein